MKLRLLPKLILLILIPVFTTLAGLSWLSYSGAEQALRKQIDDDMRIILEQQTREYIAFFKSVTTIADTFATQAQVVDAVASGNGQNAAPSTADLLRQYPYIGFVELVLPDGQVLFHQGKGKASEGYAGSEFLSQARKGSAAHSIIKDKNSQALQFFIGVPISLNQATVGTVVLGIPMENIGALYSDRIRIGSTGKCFVLDADGVVLLDPTDKASIGVNIRDIAWVQSILDNTKGLIRYDWNGEAKTCYYDFVEGLNWSVCLGITDNDLLAPILDLRNRSLLMSALALLLLAAIVFSISRSIASPLRAAAGFVDEVGRGNMNISKTMIDEQERLYTRSDEIGRLAEGIGSMYRNLKKTLAAAEESAHSANQAAAEAQTATKQAEQALLRAESARRDGVLGVTSQLEGIASTLSASAMQLSARIEQSGQGSAEQAKRVASTMEAMEEMNSTVLEVAQNASAASGFSANTRKKAESGAVLVARVVDSIKGVQKQSLALKDDMATLGTYANSISQIMGVISDIADQTNLLALNAAIEAARAGEAGRGFAVVADEVRKLAEKTASSTADVGNAIKAIQQSVQQNISNVDLAVQNIGDATVLASESGESLEEIVRMVDSTADQVRAIASASEQQSASSEEINQSIGTVNTIAGQTATAMHEAASAVGNLAAQARQLSDLIVKMKKD